MLNGTRLIAMLLSRDEVQFTSKAGPMLILGGVGPSSTASTVESGDSLRVRGFGFAPGRGATGVAIQFDGDSVANGVAVAADGRFEVTLPIRRGRGDLVVTAQQQDGRRLTRVQSSIMVVGRER